MWDSAWRISGRAESKRKKSYVRHVVERDMTLFGLILQHIHKLLCSLGDRKVLVVDNDELADRESLGEL